MTPFKKDFNIKMTLDGSLIMDRMTDRSWFWNNIKRDWAHEFIKDTLKRDGQERGVKLVSYTVDDKGVNAIVGWL